MTKCNKVAKAFNSFFRLIINSLDIFKNHHLPSNAINKIQVIISHFSNHHSILKVKLKFWINREFYFKIVSRANTKNVVIYLLYYKATAAKIPINVLKSIKFCFLNLAKCINDAFDIEKYPDTLKLSDITLVY